VLGQALANLTGAIFRLWLVVNFLLIPLVALAQDPLIPDPATEASTHHFLLAESMCA
jgi:hypothetical protein